MTITEPSAEISDAVAAVAAVAAVFLFPGPRQDPDPAEPVEPELDEHGDPPFDWSPGIVRFTYPAAWPPPDPEPDMTVVDLDEVLVALDLVEPDAGLEPVLVRAGWLRWAAPSPAGLVAQLRSWDYEIVARGVDESDRPWIEARYRGDTAAGLPDPDSAA